MRIELTVKKITSPEWATWTEEYTTDEQDYKSYARNMIDDYNATLRPGEIARELVGVRVVDGGELKPLEHKWRKTNGFTLKSNYGYYDTFECECCKITGKRYGLSPVVKKDSKYKAKKYEFCGGGR